MKTLIVLSLLLFVNLLSCRGTAPQPTQPPTATQPAEKARCQTDADCGSGQRCALVSTCPPESPDSCEGGIMMCVPEGEAP